MWTLLLCNNFPSILFNAHNNTNHFVLYDEWEVNQRKSLRAAVGISLFLKVTVKQILNHLYVCAVVVEWWVKIFVINIYITQYYEEM